MSKFLAKKAYTSAVSSIYREREMKLLLNIIYNREREREREREKLNTTQ